MLRKHWLIPCAVSLFVLLLAPAADLHAQNQPRELRLNVSKTGDGKGRIVSSPPGIQCGDDAKECAALFDAGTPVNLTVEDVGAGSIFAGWTDTSGTTRQCDGVKTPCSFVISADSAITGSFALQGAQPVTLSVLLQGDGAGTIQSDPPGIACGAGSSSCSASFAPGVTLTLTAQPAKDSSFHQWAGTGSASTCSGTGLSCSFELRQESSVTASFGKAGGTTIQQ